MYPIDLNFEQIIDIINKEIDILKKSNEFIFNKNKYKIKNYNDEINFKSVSQFNRNKYETYELFRCILKEEEYTIAYVSCNIDAGYYLSKENYKNFRESFDKIFKTFNYNIVIEKERPNSQYFRINIYKIEEINNNKKDKEILISSIICKLDEKQTKIQRIKKQVYIEENTNKEIAEEFKKMIIKEKHTKFTARDLLCCKYGRENANRLTYIMYNLL